MKIRKLIGVLLVIILIVANIPPIEQKGSAAEQTKVVKTNITVPDPIITANGVKWYATSRSGELGTVDISSLNLPSTANITSVQLLDMNGNYVKHLNDKTGTVYKIGTVPNVGEATVTADVQSLPGYFDWFSIGNSTNYWAFDLDGVRHIRKYDTSTDYPLQNGTYGNKDRTDGLTTMYTNGNIPAWYTKGGNYFKFFADETPGKADIGWAERTLDISTAKFDNPSLGIMQSTAIPISKIDNVNIRSSDIRYVEMNRTGAIPAGNIRDKVVMDDSATMIANRSA